MKNQRNQDVINCKVPATKIDLHVSLEDILTGCTKHMKISRRVLKPDGTIRIEDKVFNVKIKPGTKTRARITFYKQGDQDHGRIPGNLIFIVRKQPHSLFVREGNNIRYSEKVSIKEIVAGFFEIPTLTGEKITLDLTREVVTPNITKRFPGHGLPLFKKPSNKGDLVVSLEIKFPDISIASSQNFYQVLGVDDKATSEEIRRAFLILDNWYHSDQHRNSGLKKKSEKILEAYVILSNAEKRRKYDNEKEPEFGKSKRDRSDTNFEGFKFNSKQLWNENDPQDPAIQKDVFVSLEDVSEGCVKRMEISRRVLQPDGSTLKENKIFTINVKPGWKAGTKITFHKEGDQSCGKIPADIVFIIRDKTHALLERLGSDIKYTRTLSLKEIQDFHCNSEPMIVEIPSLNGENMSLKLTDELIVPGNLKTFRGNGLPVPNDPSRKGDLLVTFDIKFPENVGKDFYKMLGVRDNASIEEIRSAYRLLNLWYNPQVNAISGSEDRFRDILEAYQVLSDTKKRKIYDQYQEQYLQEQEYHREEQYHQEQHYQHQQPEINKDPAVNYDLYIDLEKILKGCTKTIRVSRNVIQPNGTTKKEGRLFTVNVKPGCNVGTKITFKNEGNQSHGRIPADIVFIIKDKPHSLFKRNKYDIYYTQKLSLEEALLGTDVDIPTLNYDKICLHINKEMVNPNVVKRFPEHGLPFSKEPWNKGDLVVSFDIEFPEIWKNVSEKEYIKNLQTILCIDEDANVDEIKRSYKTLALWYHPDKNCSPGSEEKFKKILEAFEVLTSAKSGKFTKNAKREAQEGYSNGDYRREYSQDYQRGEYSQDYRNRGYSWGYPNGYYPNGFYPNGFYPNGFYPNGYYPNAKRPYGGCPNEPYNTRFRRDCYPQDPPVERDLHLTLEDILKGCTKKMKITRLVLQPNGSTQKEEKVLTINVKPGWKAGTKITFEKEGNQARWRIPADVVFIIKDKPHPLFKREGNNIIFTQKLSFKEALRCPLLSIPNLTDEEIYFLLTWDKIKPGIVKNFQRQGLPFPKEPWRKGDLLVKLDILLPEISIIGSQNLYEILGLEKCVGTASIKTAFELLDQLYRSDKDGIPGAKEKLKKISDAYAVLSDVRKREMYDKLMACDGKSHQ